MLDKIYIIIGVVVAVATITTTVYKFGVSNGKETCIAEVNQNNAIIHTNQLSAILALPKTQEERFKCLKTLKCHL